ncbi:hypothetical protein [Acutalibacter sp. 1XD8-36]|uniref:hypothetical protein n=1 Tax=Acutalibacter sp. 1XD8-36 TaxID=2320852 RepID=UPI001412DEAD|nr:hypothetical protein [Acutalibacter sp. 1XD8-36]NBJ89941.1 hypothetical protein [Acutalibacter sp. 1XD8-36]
MSSQVAKIEQMKKYTKKTGFSNIRYSLQVAEMWDLINMAREKPYDSIKLAFNYGQAKGYRAAKAEVKKC